MKLAPPTRRKRTRLVDLVRCYEGPRSGPLVLVNGAFDPLHVGHIRYLEAAAALGHVLVAAVNSDRSTRANKGSNRPVVPEDERAEMLCALACIDHVIVFDEPTVAGVLAALKPDIHAKGTDYTEQTVPERAVVEAFGGRTVICGDPKNHSSSRLIAALEAVGRDRSLSLGDG